MNYGVVDLTNHESIRILPLGDLHVGSPVFLESKFRKIVRYIQENDDVYTVLMGDLIDNATKYSIGNVYENEMSPQEQLDYLMKSLEPIKKKILGIVSGNHENRTLKATGLDILAILASFFNCYYDRNILILDINVGSNAPTSKRRINYVFEIAHGFGGGRTPGGALNNAFKFGDLVVNADVVLTGHVHKPMDGENTFLIVDKRNKVVQVHKQLILIIPSLLGWEDYAQQRAYRPPSNSLYELTLNGSSKEITITKTIKY